MIVTTTKIKLMKTAVFEKDPVFLQGLSFTCKCESDLIVKEASALWQSLKGEAISVTGAVTIG